MIITFVNRTLKLHFYNLSLLLPALLVGLGRGSPLCRITSNIFKSLDQRTFERFTDGVVFNEVLDGELSFSPWKIKIKSSLTYKVCGRELSSCFFIYLLLYVDDMLTTAKSMSWINILKKQLSDEFKMKDLGAAKKI
ncbi:uncharacterized protein LOC131183063 [Hevea brasiliensis]|uniref:uncharacterized protein LOC131183063 n=1 Tax=Hevea brasiliensis TaxID=3981 RepID=UPI0025FC1C07|nr:uncharacterized protein LOC131183063 [Hevea brasiliensis]